MYTYLAASLPWCTLGQAPPMSPEEYRFQCTGVMAFDHLQELDRLLSGHLTQCQTDFGRAWAELSLQMTNEIAAHRAQTWKVHPGPAHLHPGYSLQAHQMVQEALSRESPLDMEWVLDQGRWSLLQELIPPGTPLGLERILAFGVQLTLMQRWAGLDAEQGRKWLTSLIDSTVSRAMDEL